MLKNKICFIILLSRQLSIQTYNISLPKEMNVNFEQGMQPSINLGIYSNENNISNKNWNRARAIFYKYITHFNYHSSTRIPKIIHQIYVGNPIPKKCKRLQKTWQIMHPDWKYYLWTDKEIDNFGLYNRTLYDSMSNLAQKSDIARYEILYKFGGLYVDMDFECVKSFNILHHTLDFYAGIEFNKNLRVNNALIAARPEHPILKACIERLKDTPPPLESGLSERDQEVEPVVQKTGPAFFTRIIMEYAHIENIALLPNTFFYPFNWKQPIKIYPETFAMHHWHASWVTKDILHRDTTNRDKL